MKCYFGGSRQPFEYDFVSACFANTAAEAKKLMWDKADLSIECDNDWHDARIIRKPEFDGLLDSGKTEPYIIRDDKTLRFMGWHIEGDRQCDSCGLFSFDDAFPVCECGQCIECGCEDE